MRQMKNCSAL